jgi:hypothetical protein
VPSHYRASIRDKARQLNKLQEGPDPGPFDRAKAMQSPAIRKLFDDVAKLMIDPPPVTAKFVVVTTTHFGKDGKAKEEYPVRGWLLKEEAGKIKILTPFGRRHEFELHAKPVPGADKDEGTLTCTMKVMTARQEVDRLIAIRQKEDGQFPLSERGV